MVFHGFPIGLGLKIIENTQARASLDAPVTGAQDFMVLRADRDFEPEPKLALKRCPWHRGLRKRASEGLSSSIWSRLGRREAV